jgi:hypothetical protein
VLTFAIDLQHVGVMGEPVEQSAMRRSEPSTPVHSVSGRDLEELRAAGKPKVAAEAIREARVCLLVWTRSVTDAVSGLIHARRTERNYRATSHT